MAEQPRWVELNQQENFLKWWSSGDNISNQDRSRVFKLLSSVSYWKVPYYYILPEKIQTEIKAISSISVPDRSNEVKKYSWDIAKKAAYNLEKAASWERKGRPQTASNEPTTWWKSRQINPNDY